MHTNTNTTESASRSNDGSSSAVAASRYAGRSEGEREALMMTDFASDEEPDHHTANHGEAAQEGDTMTDDGMYRPSPAGSVIGIDEEPNDNDFGEDLICQRCGQVIMNGTCGLNCDEDVARERAAQEAQTKHDRETSDEDEEENAIRKPGRAGQAQAGQREHNGDGSATQVRRCRRCRNPIVNNHCSPNCVGNATRQAAQSNTGSKHDQGIQAPATSEPASTRRQNSPPRCLICGNFIRDGICGLNCRENGRRRGRGSNTEPSGGDAASQAGATGPITAPDRSSQGPRQLDSFGRVLMPMRRRLKKKDGPSA